MIGASPGAGVVVVQGVWACLQSTSLSMNKVILLLLFAAVMVLLVMVIALRFTK